ncbi:MAG: iron-sulfur cluster carrier protein ApbC [Gammaproteobacteria bacterium]|nr:MAG: iron-sulfur cluster carrier protein ApbC [Gammaproteobacteria bacterium]
MGIENVKHIIAVASGKGGVGKSTTAVNLALALNKLGKKTGMLDADIYGPSQALMLGQEHSRPEMKDEKTMMPVVAYGIYSMSMAYLVTNETPMVWRGPMASGALQQMLMQTDWPELDILIVDMPPGTGDIQLTLAQRASLAGAVIVTTPQDIALLDAVKGIEMFRKVNVPVLGVVENMSIHICSHCGHKEPVFGEGGGERAARKFGTQLLGRLPLSLDIREQADKGTPTVISDPDSENAHCYFEIAQKLIDQLAAGNSSAFIPDISIEED